MAIVERPGHRHLHPPLLRNTEDEMLFHLFRKRNAMREGSPERKEIDAYIKERQKEVRVAEGTDQEFNKRQNQLIENLNRI